MYFDTKYVILQHLYLNPHLIPSHINIDLNIEIPLNRIINVPLYGTKNGSYFSDFDFFYNPSCIGYDKAYLIMKAKELSLFLEEKLLRENIEVLYAYNFKGDERNSLLHL